MSESDEIMEDESIGEQKRMDDESIESLRERKRMKMSTEGHGFTHNYEIWSHGYFIDMQYKELYEYLKDNYFEQVVKDKKEIKELAPCRTQEKATEFADQYKYCFAAMDEWEIHACLKDLVKDIMILEELEILKEYELFLLLSGYWKNGGHEDDNNVPCYKDYSRDHTFYLTGYNLIDVQEDFEKWIFKLESGTDAEKKDAVERDHQNRKANLPIHTRAQYTLKKLQRAEESKIISMEILKKKNPRTISRSSQARLDHRLLGIVLTLISFPFLVEDGRTSMFIEPNELKLSL